jgi:uncharacterized phage protein (TIGR02218 family)
MPVSPEIKARVANSPLALVMLWKVAARDGTTVRVCNWDSDIEFESETYTAMPFEPTEIQTSSGLQPADAEMTIPLVDPFTSVNILGGKWRGARVTIVVVEAYHLSEGPIRKHTGYLGQPVVSPPNVTLQFRSLSQVLNQPIGDQYSENCRVKRFGDDDCKANVSVYTHTATVTAVTDTQRFTISGSYADNVFYKGWVTFTSGDNDGLEEEITSNVGGALSLFVPMFGTVVVGDTVAVVEGCDRTKTRCSAIVNGDNPSGTNIENYRGEPYLPGRTKVFQYPP